MRRRDKEITDIDEIESIIKKSSVCRLGLCDNGMPYVVPICFGYENSRLYFHSANEGYKTDIIENNPQVCIEFDTDTELISNPESCSMSMKYRSAIAFGKARFVNDPDEIKTGLDLIVRQYGGSSGIYEPEILSKIRVICVEINSITGKKSGY